MKTLFWQVYSVAISLAAVTIILISLYLISGPSPSEIAYNKGTIVVYNPDILPLTDCPECGCEHYNRIECPECNYEWWEGQEEDNLSFHDRFEFLADSLGIKRY